MTVYGVTATGFVKKDLETIISEIQDDQLDLVDPNLNFTVPSRIGQLDGIIGDQLSQAWEAIEATYKARYRASASDASLEEVGSITGVPRLDARKSTVTLNQISLSTGTTLPVDSVVSCGPNGSRWVTTSAATNSTGVDATFSVFAESEEYGAVVGLSGTIDTIQTPISGWSAAAAVTGTHEGSFVGTLDDLILSIAVDGAAAQAVTLPFIYEQALTYTPAGAASLINGLFTGLNAYAVGTKVRIASLTEGYGSSLLISGTANAVLGFPTTLIKGFNSADAEEGVAVEEDPDYRIRQWALNRAHGKGTLEAIRAAVLDVVGITQAFAFENTSDHTDVNGLAAHSFEIVCDGAWDDEGVLSQAVLEAIYGAAPAGIQSQGTTEGTVTDSQGDDHIVRYSEPEITELYIEYVLTTDPDLFPVDGDDQVKAALVALADSLQIGDDVIILRFKSTCLTIAGVLDVPTFEINSDTVNIVIGYRGLATLDAGHINIPE